MNFDRQTPHRGGVSPMANHRPPPLSDELNAPHYVQAQHQRLQYPQLPQHHDVNDGHTQSSGYHNPAHPLVYIGHNDQPYTPRASNQGIVAPGPYQHCYARPPYQDTQEYALYQQNYQGAITQDVQECATYQQHCTMAPNQGVQTPYQQNIYRAPNQDAQECAPYLQNNSWAPNQVSPSPYPQNIPRVSPQNIPRASPQNHPAYLPESRPPSNQRMITSTTSISRLSDDVFYAKSSSSCPPSSSAPDSQADMSHDHRLFRATLPPGNFGDRECLPNPPFQLPPLLHCPIMMLRTDYNLSDHDKPGTVGSRQSDLGQFTAGTHRLPASGRQVHLGANIRQKDKERIKVLLQNRSIIQVCGPPMAGKSTVVRQSISELTESSVSTSSASSDGGIIQHHFDCKQHRTFTDLVTTVINKLRPGDVCTDVVDSDFLVSIFQAVLCGFSHCHHIIVFHKCEGFRSSDGGHFFLDFLAQLLHNLSLFIKVTVIFTSYKSFPPMRSGMSTVEIGVLSDIWDVVSLLQHYAPGVEVLSYAHVCIKTLCLPEAVRFLAEKFIANEEYRIPADMLEKKINRDVTFLSEVFGSRVKEVTEWIPQSTLLSIVHFCHSVDSSFEKAHLEYVSSEHDFLEWTRTIQYLKENFVIREVSVTRRLVIHPLVVYYCMTSVSEGSLVLRGQWYDQSCNKYTNFLCRLLMNTEASMRQQGRKGLVYSGLILEWPNVKYMIERALHCDRNTYGEFVQIAVSTNGLIMKCFTKEAKDFYQGLYNSAREYGTSREVAVLQAFLGNAIGASSGISKALTAETEVLDSCLEWHQANNLLDGAIEMLSKEAPSYHLMWALDKKATILHRQGKYKESIQCFKQAKQVFRQVNSQALGEQFFVSDLQVWEERITQEIQETIPLIFTGNNKLARKRLDKLLEIINYRCENHPELSTLLNLIGLTEERGNNNLADAFKWYKLSYNERMYLAKMCPENLLVSLNNMAMILLREGKLDECLRYLYQALDIRRECGWSHYSTALTLTHLSEVNIKCDNFPEAFKNALEAERILRMTVKDHDMRLRLNFTLAHIRVVLRQKMDPEVSRVYHVANNGGNPNNVPNLHQLFDDIPFDASDGGRTPTDHSPPWTAAPQSASKNRDTAVKVCPDYPCASSHPFVTTIHIDPVDLSMSADNYLDRVIQIAHEMTGTLSDDGHNNYLATHMHAMVLNWNDRGKFLDHINAIRDYTNQNPWIEETVFGDESVSLDSRYNRLRKQKPLFYYIVNTPVEHLDLDRFTQLLVKSCQICAFAERIYTCEMWSREARHLMWVRQEKDSFGRMFDNMALDDLETLDVEPHENCLTHCSNSKAAACDGGGTGTLYGTPAACDSDISSGNLHSPDRWHVIGNNIFAQSNSMDNNNLSQVVESPKILQDQKDIMEKIKCQHQPPSQPNQLDDMNMTSPKGYNFACREHQKKGSGGSKVIPEVSGRVPVEQSEISLAPDAHPESQITADPRRKHETCVADLGGGAGVGGSADKLRHFLQPGTNTNSPTLTNKQHLNEVKLPEPVENSGDNEPPKSNSDPQKSEKFSVSRYLRLAWPEITSAQSQASTDLKQSILTESTPSLSDQKNDNKSQKDLQATPDPLSKVSCLERQLDQPSVKNASPCLGSCSPKRSVHKGVSPRDGEKKNSCGDNGRLSFAESGFAGSSLSSEDDHTNHELSQSGRSVHNIVSRHSNVNPESGFLSQGAKPKTPKTEMLAHLSHSHSNEENFVDSPIAGYSGDPDFGLDLEEGRVPRENCENFLSCSNPRKPEEGLWCDYSGQSGCYSEEGFQTVISPEQKDVTKL